MIDSRVIKDLQAEKKRCREKGHPIGVSATYQDIYFQNNIYAQGRRKPVEIITNAKWGKSTYNYKLTLDIFKNIKSEAYCDSSFLGYHNSTKTTKKI